MMYNKKPMRARLPQWLAMVIGISFVILLWAASLYLVAKALALGIPPKTLPSSSDLMTLFFGTSALSLTLFSFFLAGLGLVGWQTLKQNISEGVETAMHGRLQSLQNEMRGRVLSSMALFMGLMHSDPLRLEQQDESREYLAEAVQMSYEAYKLLKEADSDGRYMALNNFVYFSCLGGQDHRRAFLLESARTLKSVGEERNYLEAQLTYCRVILQFSSNLEDIAEAHSTATSLLKAALNERQRKEATFYVASLKAKLEAQSRASNSDPVV
jgi:hypothetical protein